MDKHELEPIPVRIVDPTRDAVFKLLKIIGALLLAIIIIANLIRAFG